MFAECVYSSQCQCCFQRTHNDLIPVTLYSNTVFVIKLTFFLHLLLVQHRKTTIFQAKLESWLCCSLLCPELFFLSLRWSLQWHQGLRSTQGFFWVLKHKIGIKCYNIIIVQFKCSFASSQKCPNSPNWYLSHSEMKREQARMGRAVVKVSFLLF